MAKKKESWEKLIEQMLKKLAERKK